MESREAMANASSAPTITSPQYAFIDGLRALAALSVATLHGFLFTGLIGQSAEAFPLLANFVLNGGYGVAVFIVLSGFVITLPIADKPEMRLANGVRHFLRRRARRILPPYYAALCFFVLLIVTVPILQNPRGTAWEGKVPITAGGLISHVFLTYNLTPHWAYQIDGPMWSVATEAQIYLLMPLILLPLWRRIGGIATVLIGVVGGYGIAIVVPGVSVACPWFVGLFAMGMFAARVVRSGTPLHRLKAFTTVSTLGLLLVLTAGHRFVTSISAAIDVLVGLLTASWLVIWCRQVDSGHSSIFVRFLSSRPLTFLGFFSYSFYLFHSPILGLWNLATLDLAMPMWLRLIMMWGVAVPVSLFVSYLAHLLVERRFLTAHQRQA